MGRCWIPTNQFVESLRRSHAVPDGIVVLDEILLHRWQSFKLGCDAFVDLRLFFVGEDSLHVAVFIESAGTSQDGIHVELLKRLVSHPGGIAVLELLSAPSTASVSVLTWVMTCLIERSDRRRPPFSR